jgi:pyruvate kinase
MLRTKIVCTIGPASRSPEMLRELVRSGMNVARLNFSHGDLNVHAENVARIHRASEELDRPVAILMDLQGPKLRVGEMEGNGVVLSQGEQVTLTTRPILGHSGEIPVQYQSLPQLAERGDRILMDDGLLEVIVLGVDATEIHTKVVTGGLLTSNKGMNLPHAHSSISAITEKDRSDLEFAVAHQADWIALSFVRTAKEVLDLRTLIAGESSLGRPIPVIAKIEKPEAVENIDAIIEAANGIMVARGDLGIESAPEGVPLIQKMIIKKCNDAGVPVITATQMLDSMIRNPRPTRAEASDVANAILDGTDALMLSGETAAGEYPLQSLQTMVRIAQRTEADIFHMHSSLPVRPPQTRDIAEAVSHSACETARHLDATAIITPTASGHTARMVAKYRPPMPIIAVTPSPGTRRRICLLWGVHPLLAKRTDNTDELLADAVAAARCHGYVQPGDLVVITAGAAGSAPLSTNLIRVHVVERILCRGTGVGSRCVQGEARVLGTPLLDPSEIRGSDILVICRTTPEIVALAEKAAGLVTAEGDASSHAAQLATELGIPAVVGVGESAKALKDRQTITLDPGKGLVYEGSVRA